MLPGPSYGHRALTDFTAKPPTALVRGDVTSHFIDVETELECPPALDLWVGPQAYWLCFPLPGHQGGAMGLEGARYIHDNEILVYAFGNFKNLFSWEKKRAGVGVVGS